MGRAVAGGGRTVLKPPQPPGIKEAMSNTNGVIDGRLAGSDVRDRERIKGEYREMPGLKLTAAQASRFWHLGFEESTKLLDSLVADGALARTRDGFYIFAKRPVSPRGECRPGFRPDHPVAAGFSRT